MPTVDWPTRVITVSQNELLLISGDTYELDLDQIRLDLLLLEATEGIAYPSTHRHVAPVTFGGTTLARVVEFINNYQVVFEDTGSPYNVSATGANSNILDVYIPSPGISLAVNNSVSLDVAAIRDEVWNAVMSNYTVAGTAGEQLTSASTLLDDPITSHITVGSVGEAIQQASTPSLFSIDLLNTALLGHTSIGSVGAALLASSDTSLFANAVLDAQLLDHQSVGSVGEGILSAASILEEPQSNHTTPGTIGSSINDAATGATSVETAAPRMSVSYDESVDEIDIIVWLTTGSVIQASPTDVAVTWREQNGNVLFSLATADFALTGSGYYEVTQGQALSGNSLYFVEVSITDGSGTYTATLSVSTS